MDQDTTTPATGGTPPSTAGAGPAFRVAVGRPLRRIATAGGRPVRSRRAVLAIGLLTSAAAVLGVGCQGQGPPARGRGRGSAADQRPPEFGPPVSREDILAKAEAFRRHRWFAEPRHVRHGDDADGIRVDTPDVSLPGDGHLRPDGWWRPGRWNEGIPYQWGGFSSLAEFDQGLRMGLAAGDVYTPAKRRHLHDAVSRHAVGLDCSGFISRVWRLPRHHSTRELEGLSRRLASYDELQPGDILNRWNDHVVLFVRFTDPGRTKFEFYHTGGEVASKVTREQTEVANLQRLGFVPLRYRNVR